MYEREFMKIFTIGLIMVGIAGLLLAWISAAAALAGIISSFEFPITGG